MAELQVWDDMFAGWAYETWHHLSESPRYVEMYGRTPVPVIAYEDPEGEHYGWLGAEHAHYEADTHPQMVQPRASLFRMQFPYGPEAEVEHGRGRIVRLRIEPK